MKRKIAVIPGDGIGPEVIEQGLRVLSFLDEKMQLHLNFVMKDWGAEKWLHESVGLPKGALDDLRDNYDAIYFGALGDPRIPDMAHGREILLGMRFGLDLYANIRPVQLMHPSFCRLKKDTPIDIVIVRENTEDSYVSMGGNFKGGTDDEIAIDESVHSKKGVERIIRHAFLFAQEHGRKKVTLVDKSNAIRFGGSLWQRLFKQISDEFTTIKANHMFVDVAAMQMVQSPELFDVIVTTNLFGDILSDLGAGIVGGLGLMASGNINPEIIGLFEPVHGSAPDIAGQNIANPIAAFLTAAMMLRFLLLPQAAVAIERSVTMLLCNGPLPRDLGGTASTRQIGDAILALLKTEKLYV